MNLIKHAELKIVCICIEIYKIFEGNDYDKVQEVLSELKFRKTNKILIEKKDMIVKLDFEQNYLSKTSTGINKKRKDSI